MADNPKTIPCSGCGSPMSKKAKACPPCGAKSKRPIYKRAWMIAFVAIVVIGAIGFVGCGGRKGEKFEWYDMELGSVLPTPQSNVGEILDNSDDQLSIYIYSTSKDDYKIYVSECQSKGFVVESEKSDRQYTAFNEDGYELELWYNDYDKELHISLEAPLKMEALQWPTSELVNSLPVPCSGVGKVSSESTDRFAVLVGETSLEDYCDYVNACSAYGFSVDYEKGDKFYRADHADGYHISVEYRGNNVMSVEIERTEEAAPESAVSTNKPAAAPETDTAVSTPEPDPVPDKTPELVDGMRPTFLEAMNSYEAFYDEYCAFMKEYKEDPTNLTLIGKYTELLEKLTEMDEKFAAWENNDLNDAELTYYLEVNSRVVKKLLETAQ